MNQRVLASHRCIQEMRRAMSGIFNDTKYVTIGNFHRKVIKHASGGGVTWTQKDVFMAYLTRNPYTRYPKLDWKGMWASLKPALKMEVTFKALGYTKLQHNRMQGLHDCMMQHWRDRGSVRYRWSEALLAYHTKEVNRCMPYEAFMYREEYGLMRFRLDIVEFCFTV
ncbi:hypothetical protein CYMTET_37608 [Cymbomonas tetramitiformis]|uniref:Uncharacterized protein n=1 Tax=Cymbomonas tetramitiformis TaxID=36881 RepID=A0AAE0CFT3_9CHLO|nr:hypothetical protein CYMTET_37608 [Cymbomonas tetramitiformis]